MTWHDFASAQIMQRPW